MCATSTERTGMGIFFPNRLIAGANSIVYSQLSTYFKTKSKLADYGIALVSWYLVLGASAQAQTQPIDSTTVGGYLTLDNWFYSDDLTVPTATDGAVTNPQVAQSTTIPLPSLIVPGVVLPTLLPLSQPIPINSILAPAVIQAPNNTPAIKPTNAPNAPNVPNVPSVVPTPAPTKDPRYLIPPQVLDPKVVDPFSTQFILNGNKVSHLSTAVITTGEEFGSFRNSDFSFDAYKMLGASNVQSVTSDRVVRVKSQLEVAGARSIIQNQDISIAVAQPQTLLGFREQISVMGDCLDGSGQTCTFLPGIKIDNSVIDPQKLQPTGVRITSQFADVISPASVAEIQQPGFQGGANGDEYGIDLYLPAVGVVSSSESPVLTGSRQVKFGTGAAIYNARLTQNFATNGRESSLGRTIRSLNYIHGDNNQLVNLGVNALAQVLPEIQSPGIAPGLPGARIVVNPNLYRAANSIRVPANSLTVYQGGTGYAPSFGSDPRIPPAATHQAVWIGLSPVVQRSVTQDYRYVTLGEPTIVASGGGEGGTVPVSVNLNNFGFNSVGLQNAYSQGYVTVYNQKVDRVDVSTISQRTDYYPQISFTGTRLNENTLWRYFTGAIFNVGSQSAQTNPDIKAYVGTDYSIVNPRGVSFSVGGVGYVNPDPEHYTQLFANANQSIALGSNPRNNLVFGVNANYIADGAITLESVPISSTQSFVNAGVALNLGNISIGGTQFFGNLLPGSIDSKTVFNVGWKVNDRLKIGAFVSAFDQNISTNPIGASLSWGLDPNSNSILALSWNAAEIDFRRTIGPTANVYHDNTVSVSLRYGF
ncbi:hypothetical protein [Chamaesiphon sp. OTE_75_metabat_556]|uniref:hypothetical protein n=1 Tax=Chamaesiphon sp. OTE_75_metabat_556 TaxID=2964692 RepID=UPI00286B003B|nr:hypothetical protein [Chamaesiphon sp. OTE_75_metabat_556]